MLIGFIFTTNKDLIYGHHFAFYCSTSICHLRLIRYSGGSGVVKASEILLSEINYPRQNIQQKPDSLLYTKHPRQRELTWYNHVNRFVSDIKQPHLLKKKRLSLSQYINITVWTFLFSSIKWSRCSFVYQIYIRLHNI